MTFAEVYPIEEMKTVEKHLREVWSGNVKSTYSCISMKPNYRQLTDNELALELAAENILLNAKYPGFNPPRVIIDYGTVSTAAYWGGEIKLPVGGCVSIEPIIHQADQALSVKAISPDRGDGEKALEFFNQVCHKLNTKELYCSTIDFQGPLTTAALLWEQTDFMVSMYTEPEIVHEFLDRVTTQLIAIMKNYLKKSNGRVCANVWPYIWLPSDLGICMTEDYMPLISPELYKEFGIPYVERISKEFGGLFIHCCGEFEHQIENLKNSEINILGLEFHFPHTRPEVLFNAFGDSVLFVPYMAPRGYDQFKTKSEYFAYLKTIKNENTRLWFILDPDDHDYEQQLSVVQEMVQ